MQDEIFPDEDDFGRIFRNNAVLSAMGVPQYAAIMGNCVAGGAYLPVLCDKLLMTDGSAALPGRAGAGEGGDRAEVDDDETLGGAAMHAQVSGTVDFHEPDDEACLKRLRSLIALLPATPGGAAAPVRPARRATRKAVRLRSRPTAQRVRRARPARLRSSIAGSLQEYKAEYGQTLVCAYAADRRPARSASSPTSGPSRDRPPRACRSAA